MYCDCADMMTSSVTSKASLSWCNHLHVSPNHMGFIILGMWTAYSHIMAHLLPSVPFSSGDRFTHQYLFHPTSPLLLLSVSTVVLFNQCTYDVIFVNYVVPCILFYSLWAKLAGVWGNYLYGKRDFKYLFGQKPLALFLFIYFFTLGLQFYFPIDSNAIWYVSILHPL